MREDLRSWLAGNALPVDFYQLMGQPRFSRDREALIAAGRAGYAELQSYQNADQTLRRRARDLQLQFASAVQVFSSNDTWRAYDEKLQRSTTAIAATAPVMRAAAAATAPVATVVESTILDAVILEGRPAPADASPRPVPPVDAAKGKSAGDVLASPAARLAPNVRSGSDESVSRHASTSWIRSRLPFFDPRGVRLMLFWTAVTANGLLALGGLTIYLLWIFSRSRG